MTQTAELSEATARAAQTEWDLVVIGGGTAGLVAARTAARLGAQVLLVERDRLGGECLWTGCVPSKSLIASARAAGQGRHDSAVGVRSASTADVPAVLAHVREAMIAIAPHDSGDSLRSDGVAVLQTAVRFTGRRTLTTDEGDVLRFRQAVIATGSAPRELPLEGDDVQVLTNETVWDLESLPQRLAILGGGPVGCELAQAFARLGVAVTLLQRGPRLLSKEDPDAATVVAEALRADGVDVRCGAVARRLESEDGAAGTLVLADGSRVGFDRLLMALGRRPRTEALGLESAGVDLTGEGDVRVDDGLTTSNPRIRAVGDVTALPRFTHVAGVNGSTAATNAVLGLRRRVGSVVPRVTFTSPEVAAVGVQAHDSDGQHVVTVQHRDLDRAITDSDTSGFTRLVLDRRGVVVGGTIVGPRAGESLAEITLAVTHRLSASDIARTTHPYPTFNDGVWNAAIEVVRDRIDRGALKRLIDLLAAVRRRRMR